MTRNKKTFKGDLNLTRTVQGYHPSNPKIVDLWADYSPTTAGVYIDEFVAQNVSTVYACITLIAQTLASLPIGCYRKKANDDREAVDQHPAHWLFNKSPDDIMPAYMATETSQAHVLLRGNSYFELIRNMRGQAIKAYLLDPRNMSVQLAHEGTETYPEYKYTQPKGAPITYDRSEVLHFPNWSTNGLVGTSPLTLFGESLGITVAANRYASNYFAKGGHPLGFLTREAKFQQKEKETLRDEWKEFHGGVDNSHQVGLLSGGVKWENIGMSNHDAQLLGLRQFQKYELASVFRVPPFLIGDVQQPLSDIEFILIQFMVFTMLPWLKRRESELNLKVFTPKERFTYYLEHNADAILRGTLKSRQEALQIQARNGALLLNEWRHLENRNSIEGGDIPLIMASQIAKLDDVITGKANLDTTNKKSAKPSPQKENQLNRIAKAYERLPPDDRQKLKDMIVLMNGKGKLPV